MSEKSFVTLEQKVCVVCHAKYNTDSLLLDQRMRPSFDRETVTGYGWCPTHQAKRDEGFIMLVGIDETKSTQPFTPRTVYHTGEIAMVKSEAWPRLFNVPIPTGALCYVDHETLVYLEQLAKDAEARGGDGEEAAEG